MAPITALPSLLLSSLLTVLLLLITPTSAHFYLNYPPTIGFDDSLESVAPCGSFTVDFSKDNVTNFHVGGDSIALTSIHPMATWLFRATLDQTATSGNWTSLLPAIVQTGLGSYCERDVKVTESWAGQKGVIGVVQDAPDGILFQCAAVNFVTGTAQPPSVCSNVTGLSASYTTDAKLSSLPATAAATVAASSGATSSASVTAGGTTPSPSTTKASEASVVSGGFSSILVLLSIFVAVVFAGVI